MSCDVLEAFNWGTHKSWIYFAFDFFMHRFRLLFCPRKLLVLTSLVFFCYLVYFNLPHGAGMPMMKLNFRWVHEYAGAQSWWYGQHRRRSSEAHADARICLISLSFTHLHFFWHQNLGPSACRSRSTPRFVLVLILEFADCLVFGFSLLLHQQLISRMNIGRCWIAPTSSTIYIYCQQSVAVFSFFHLCACMSFW